MKAKNIKNFGIALLVTAGMSACNDSANKTAENMDGDTSNSMSGTSGQMTTENTAQSDDAKLVSELVESMHGGIALMQQGQQTATSPAVKNLAKKLETEHTGLTNELKELAAKKGWSVPASASSDDMKKMEDMADDNVNDYQKEWLEKLKDRHETNIKKLENSKTTDPDLQAASAKGLPKLRELLGNIKSVQMSMK